MWDFWKRSTFWLVMVASVLPGSWLRIPWELEPVRVYARSFRRGA
jgi:hypothetical protein